MSEEMPGAMCTRWHTVRGSWSRMLCACKISLDRLLVPWHLAETQSCAATGTPHSGLLLSCARVVGFPMAIGIHVASNISITNDILARVCP